MNDKEKLIREQRTIEATRKGLMGMDGKFGVILRQLGNPIIAQGGSMYESTTFDFDNYWQLPEEAEDQSEIDTMSEDEAVTEIGLVFDALSSGVHLEMKYMTDKKELLVTYKGYPIYCEVGGDLDCYVPMEEWEQIVDDLYAIAKKREGKDRYNQKQEYQEESQREKMGFLEKLRLRLGI